MITIFTDGLTIDNPGGPGFYAFVVYKAQDLIKEGMGYIGTGHNITNNVAEYTAILKALEWAKDNLDKDEKREIILHSDSELAIKQLNEEYKCRDEKLKPFYNQIKELTMTMVGLFDSSSDTLIGNISYKWIPREQNEYADKLCWRAYFKNFMQEKRVKKANELTNDDIQILEDGSFIVHGYKIPKDMSSCECGDWKYKCRNFNIKCKHLILLEKYLEFLEEEQVVKLEEERAESTILDKLAGIRDKEFSENLTKLQQKIAECKVTIQRAGEVMMEMAIILKEFEKVARIPKE